MKEILRIGNCSGFYGDRFSAAREMVEGGDLDILTGDYLAELTMFIMWKAQQAGRPAYAGTFLRQMEEVLGTCLDRGIRIVTNAGGLAPSALARDLGSLAERLGLSATIAHVEGDDLMARMSQLRSDGHEFKNLDTGMLLADASVEPVTANAYLGGRGIAEALSQGADIVICPRVTDASLVVGPCLWNFGWDEGDLDQLAGAVAAGHIIECGAQATGGNFALFHEVPDMGLPGYPIAEMRADGSAVITKHEATSGQVTVDTVTAQLVYEVAGVEYPNPDVTLLLDTIDLVEEAPNRILVTGARGLAASTTTKVSMSCLGPWRQSIAFAITGREVEAKAALVKTQLLATLGDVERFENIDWRLLRTDQPNAPTNELALARYIVTFTSKRKEDLGRRIFDAAIGLALSSYPGFFLLEESQRRPSQSGIHWPALIDQSEIKETIQINDREPITIPARPVLRASDSAGTSSEGRHARSQGTDLNHSTGETDRVPLGTIAAARSGDKGAHANVGIWVSDNNAFAWLADYLSVERFRELLPEAVDFPVTVTVLPNLRALNFVVHGLLGEGAAAVARFDPQAKGLGEYILSRDVDIPRIFNHASSTPEEALA